MLGGSLWYVARRLSGNTGGYIALLLYCFSPAMIAGVAGAQSLGEMGAVWGAFGAVWTAIAVAHTLYAPREVVLWNWRRILLLGLSLAVAIGSQFSSVILIPLALAFMWYLAPGRRMAVLVIWTAALVCALFLLYASYFFHPGIFSQGIRHASFSGVMWRAFVMGAAYKELGAQLVQSSPALVIALPFALASYIGWPRTRYFGNTAPLLMAVLFLILGLGSPHYPGLGFQLAALPFLFVFVAGICADLLETPYRNLVQACVVGL